MKIKNTSFNRASLTYQFLILGWVLMGCSVSAQSWTNRYNGPGNGGDWAYAIVVDDSGNAYVTGESPGSGTALDFATLKYSSAGVLLWGRRYNGPGNGSDRARAIAVDASGSVYVTGWSLGSGTDLDYATIKYSSTGVPLWTQRYNGPVNGMDTPYAIALDASGNVYVTGESQSAIGSVYDYNDVATVAYSSSGVQLWVQRFNGPWNYRDAPRAIAVDNSGNVYVSGYSSDGPVPGSGHGHFITVAYSSAGVPLWTQLYNELGGASSIAVDGSGNVYVAGGISGNCATIKYSSAGVPLWTRLYNGLGAASAIALDPSGNVYATGRSPDSGTDADCVTLKYSSDGILLWTNRYNGPENDSELAEAIAVDSSGNAYITGISLPSDGSIDSYYSTVAYSSDGAPLWSRRYNGPGNSYDRANAIAVDSSGSVYVTGQSTGSGSGEDYATIKYSPPLADHFTCSLVQSPQVIDIPFPVTITAKTLSGSDFPLFTNTVAFSGYAPGLVATNWTLGDGTTPWDYPLYTRYQDARTQVIYPLDETQDCTMTSLALEVTTAPGQTLENWTIRMKQTPLSHYSSPQWETDGWTVVYQGNEPAGTTGWRTFEFSTPFEFIGSDNLMIDFSFNNASFSPQGQCQCTELLYYNSITYASDSKDGDPLNWSGSNPVPVLSHNVPNIVIGATVTELLPVLLSPTVSGSFVNGVWTGEVTVHEAVSNLVLRAQSDEGPAGETNPFDVQGVAQPTVIVTDDGQLGMTNGCFGFNVQGQAGQVVVLEVSTNLVDWLPLQTNVCGADPFYFNDPDTSLFNQRFYRVVAP